MLAFGGRPLFLTTQSSPVAAVFPRGIALGFLQEQMAQTESKRGVYGKCQPSILAFPKLWDAYH